MRKDKLLFGGLTEARSLAPRIYEGGAPVRTLGRGESVENWKPGTFTFGWFRSKAGCLRRPFSCPAKKMDKNAAKGGVEAACSRRRAPPFGIPPARFSVREYNVSVFNELLTEPTPSNSVSSGGRC